MKRFKYKSVFTKFIISYLWLTITFLGITFIAFNYVTDLVTEEIIDFKQSQLVITIKEVDARIEEIKNIIDTISLSPDFNELYLVNKPISNKEYYKFIKFHEQIKIYSLTNDYIKNLAFYLVPSETIITTDHIDSDIEKYYNNFLKHDDIPFEEWFVPLTEGEMRSQFISEQQIKTYNETYQAIRVVQYLPNRSISGSRAVAMAYIDKQTLLNHFHYGKGEENFLLVNHNGNYLVSSEDKNDLQLLSDLEFEDGEYVKNVDFRDQTYLIFRNVSEENNLEYFYGMTIDEIMEDMSIIKQVALLALIIILLVGTGISAYFSYRNSRPIKRIADLMKKSESGYKAEIDEYEYINGKISRLLNDNESMKDQLLEQKPTLRLRFMDHLFIGAFIKKSILESKASQLGIQFASKQNVVAALKFGKIGKVENNIEQEVYEISLVSIRNLCQELFGDNIHQHIVGDRRIALIIGYQHPDDLDGIYDKFEEITFKMKEELLISINVGLSNVCTQLIDLHFALEEATKALDYRLNLEQKNIRWFHQIPQLSQAYFYPIETEQKLINLVKVGQDEKSFHILDEIFRRNFMNVKLTEWEIEQLFWEIRGTIRKILNSVHLQEKEQENIANMVSLIGKEDTVNETFVDIRYIFKEVTRQIKQLENQENTNLIKEIKAFINDQYANEGLGLTYVADAFSMDEKVLSSFFKEHALENFTSYVLDVRMEAAVNLILNTDKPLTEIAIVVGYRNMNTFYRAFKRKYFVSPSVYKKEHIK